MFRNVTNIAYIVIRKIRIVVSKMFFAVFKFFKLRNFFASDKGVAKSNS